MQTAQVMIEGISAYSQSKHVDKEVVPYIGKETHDDYEKRTWKNRVHVDEQGGVFMPPMSLKKALEGASPYLGKIPGQGQATYTKRVKSGLLITDPIALFVSGRAATFDDWQPEWLFLDSDGKSNSGKRVKRCMPKLSSWSASAVIYVIDEVLTESVLKRLIDDAGKFVGVGRFRPANGGFYGRFKLKKMEIK